MPDYVTKLIKLMKMAFIIPNCDAMFCSKIYYVNKHGFYDTEL